MGGLLFYNPPAAEIAFGDAPDYQRFSAIFKAFNGGSFVDRLGLIKNPVGIALDEACRLPALTGPVLSYEECCFEKAKQILDDSNRLNVPIYLFFSGGIDSTTVAATFLKCFPYADLKDRLIICTTTECWYENPNFVKNFLSGKFQFDSAYNTPRLYDKKRLIVTGELNEHFYLWNTPTKNMTVTFGDNSLNDGYSTDYLRRYLQSREMTEPIWLDLLDQNIREAPVSIKTIGEALWWICFNFMWQNCKYRMFAITKDSPIDNAQDFNTYVQHFFDTPNFQRWGMLNTFRSTLKPHSRKVIFGLTRDMEYHRKKRKFSSLVHVNVAKQFAAGITTDFQMVRDLKPFYNAENSFR